MVEIPKRGGGGPTFGKNSQIIPYFFLKASLNQEDKKEGEEVKVNFEAGKGETVCIGSRFTIFLVFQSMIHDVNREVGKERQFFIGSKDSHF